MRSLPTLGKVPAHTMSRMRGLEVSRGLDEAVGLVMEAAGGDARCVQQ